MVDITKQEAFALRKILKGDDAVKHSLSRRKHYFLVESPYNMQKLKELRENNVVYKRGE